MQNPIWIIAKKEFSTFFDSLTAYIILIAFLGFSGFFTWFFGSDIFMRKEADLGVFFGIAKWTLFFFIPAITMKMLAEEKKSGTIELLVTKAITHRQIILGKFIACLLLVCTALTFTLPYYFSVSNLGNMDHGTTISGYIGLIFYWAIFKQYHKQSNRCFSSRLIDRNRFSLFIRFICIWQWRFLGKHF